MKEFIQNLIEELKDDFEECEEMGVDLLEKLLEENTPEATFKAGLMFEQGLGATKSPGASIGYYKEAAAQGYQPAIYKLSPQRDVQLSSEQNQKTSSVSFVSDTPSKGRVPQKVAQKADVSFRTAITYHHIECDYKKAAKHYLIARAEGHCEADSALKWICRHKPNALFQAVIEMENNNAVNSIKLVYLILLFNEQKRPLRQFENPYMKGDLSAGAMKKLEASIPRLEKNPVVEILSSQEGMKLLEEDIKGFRESPNMDTWTKAQIEALREELVQLKQQQQFMSNSATRRMIKA